MSIGARNRGGKMDQPGNSARTPAAAGRTRTNTILRDLFILGFALNVVLFFLPSHQTKPVAFMFVSEIVLKLSGWHYLYALLLKGGHVGFGIGYALVLLCPVMFAVLAGVRPRRWVFTAGACFSILWLLFELLTIADANDPPMMLPHVLNGIGSAITIPGFWIAAAGRDRAQPAGAPGAG